MNMVQAKPSFSRTMLTHFLFFFILATAPVTVSDLTADRAALLSLRSAVGGRTALWNLSETNPCQWTGITCKNYGVAAVRLPGMALFGQIPTGVFSGLTELRTLSLRRNALRGPLPPDLDASTRLRNLFLQGNGFTGKIPESLFSLHSLVHLDFSDNKLSGVISPRFNDLQSLRTLYLQNNRFSGTIPELKLGKIHGFNVSSNMLKGAIPNSLQSIASSSFARNYLCGKPLSPCINNSTEDVPVAVRNISSSAGDKKRNKNQLPGGTKLGIVAAIVVILFFSVLVLLVLILKRKKQLGSFHYASFKQQDPTVPSTATESKRNTGERETSTTAAPMAGGLVGEKELVFMGENPKVFALIDLWSATAEVLGKGTHWTSYKGVLQRGDVVVIKRLKNVSVSEAEFKENMEMIGTVSQHQNLLQLRAYYYGLDEKLLIFDHMPAGSLSKLLHGSNRKGGSSLDWESRLDISLGIARGIAHLHSQGANVSHGSIKASNVLLSQSCDVRVCDFCLVNLIGPTTTNRVDGYRAPELTGLHRVSQKADVYSFGVVLLELFTGKPPLYALHGEEGTDLPRWVQSVIQEDWTSEIFDRALLNCQNAENEMIQLLKITIDCVAPHPDFRPSMAKVIEWLENIRSAK